MISLIMSCIEVTDRVKATVRRGAAAAAEALARRPRGQQLLRQTDRVLEVVERSARWISCGDGVTHSSYFPVSFYTMIPLITIVLPTFMLGVIIISIPILPLAVPVIVLGPIVNLCYDGTISTFVGCFPTPSKLVNCIRHRRRTLRAIRLNGVRDMRSADNVAPEESPLGKLLFWWPVAILAITGQVMGLGEPYVPAQWSQTPEGKEEFEVSPRKRKLEQASEGEQRKATTRVREEDEGSTTEDSEYETAPNEEESRLIQTLAESILGMKSTDKEEYNEDQDPDYEPDEPLNHETDDDSDKDDADADEEDEKEEKNTTPTKQEESNEQKSKEPVNTGFQNPAKKNIPKIVIVEESNGSSLAQNRDTASASPSPLALDSPTNEFFTPNSGSDVESEPNSPAPKTGEKSKSLIDAEAAQSSSSSDLVSGGGKQIENPIANSPISKNLSDSDPVEEHGSPDSKDGTKSKALFGGIFKRRSSDK